MPKQALAFFLSLLISASAATAGEKAPQRTQNPQKTPADIAEKLKLASSSLQENFVSATLLRAETADLDNALKIGKPDPALVEAWKAFEPKALQYNELLSKLLSLEPQELAALVRAVRSVESGLGDGRKVPASGESNIASVARRSVVAACDISVGTRLTADMLVFRRPGTGLPPSMAPYLFGRTTNEFISRGALLRLEMLS